MNPRYLLYGLLLILVGCGDDDFTPIPITTSPTNGLRYRTLNYSGPVTTTSGFCDKPHLQIHRNRRAPGSDKYAVRMGWYPEDVPVSQVAVQFLGTNGPTEVQQRNLFTVSDFLSGSGNVVPHPWVVVNLKQRRYQSLLLDENDLTVLKSDPSAEMFFQFNVEDTPDCATSWGTTIKTRLNYSGYLYTTDAPLDSIYIGWLDVYMNNTAYE